MRFSPKVIVQSQSREQSLKANLRKLASPSNSNGSGNSRPSKPRMELQEVSLDAVPHLLDKQAGLARGTGYLLGECKLENQTETRLEIQVMCEFVK